MKERLLGKSTIRLRHILLSSVTFRESGEGPGFLVHVQGFREGAVWGKTHLTPILLPALAAEFPSRLTRLMIKTET